MGQLRAQFCDLVFSLQLYVADLGQEMVLTCLLKDSRALLHEFAKTDICYLDQL